VYQLIESPLRQEGCEIADLVLSRYRRNTMVRVFVYADGGVSLEKCTQLSGIVGDLLDGTDLFTDGYTLEISSPGLDRPLRTLRDFKYRIGEKVRIGFLDTHRKTVTAEIVSTSEHGVQFRNDDGPFEVALDEIEWAKIQY